MISISDFPIAIYSVIINDRHTDIDVESFFSLLEAVNYAKKVAEECARDLNDIYEEDIKGWEYAVYWGNEGDKAYVLKKSIQPLRGAL